MYLAGSGALLTHEAWTSLWRTFAAGYVTAPAKMLIRKQARATDPKGNRSLRLRDTLGRISTNEDVADVYPKEGQPAEAPWRLALVSVTQF